MKHIEFGDAQVVLLTHTSEPELVCATAARLCVQSGGLKRAHLAEHDYPMHIRYDRARSLIRRVLSYGHDSILEHASFTFGLEGMSRACSHQLVRHRVASYSQQSQRYIDLTGEHKYIKPDTIADNPKASKYFDEITKLLSMAYDELTTLYDIPSEDARSILPNAASTSLVMTMNARELRHFFKLRCCVRAQKEIRTFAHLIHHDCMRVAPSLFEGSGAPCHECPEGEKGCHFTKDTKK